jgi:hypothetical protein
VRFGFVHALLLRQRAGFHGHVLVQALAGGHGDLVVVPRARDARAVTGHVLHVAVQQRRAHVVARRVHGEYLVPATQKHQMSPPNLDLKARVIPRELVQTRRELERRVVVAAGRSGGVARGRGRGVCLHRPPHRRVVLVRRGHVRRVEKRVENWPENMNIFSQPRAQMKRI